MGPNKENIVGWFEIAVDDMKRAKNFYETVFELKLEKLNVPSDSQADLQMMIFPMSDDATGSPGALLKMDGCPAGNNSVVVYFSCQDCAVEAARVEKAGGKVFKSKLSIGQYGFVAYVFDTEGNMIGLHSRS